MIQPRNDKNESPQPRKGYFITGSILFLGASFEFFKTWDVESLIKLDIFLLLRLVGLCLLMRWLISCVGESNLGKAKIEKMIIHNNNDKKNESEKDL